MKLSSNSRMWLQLAGALAVVALGWGGVLLEVVDTSGPAPILPAVMVTGGLVALTAGLVFALSRSRSVRDVVLAYLIYTLAVLGGGALCTP